MSTESEQLRHKIGELRRQRDAHQMDESDYVDGIMVLITRREQEAALTKLKSEIEE